MKNRGFRIVGSAVIAGSGVIAIALGGIADALSSGFGAGAYGIGGLCIAIGGGAYLLEYLRDEKNETHDRDAS